jgi:hypothetical protein
MRAASSVGERYIDTVEVTSSILVPPTIRWKSVNAKNPATAGFFRLRHDQRHGLSPGRSKPMESRASTSVHLRRGVWQGV